MATKKSAPRSKPKSARAAPKRVTRPAQRAARSRSVLKRHATSPQRQSTPLAPATSAQVSRQARLIALLQSEPVATISQMRSLTGWQVHTVRGTISGALRKRLGLNVVCNAMNESGARIYRIVAAQASAYLISNQPQPSAWTPDCEAR